MCRFPELRERLARLRRKMLILHLALGVVLEALVLLLWFATNDAFFLFLAVLLFVVTLITNLSLRRTLCPIHLRRTVRLLNANKRYYRKHFGVYFSVFSSSCHRRRLGRDTKVGENKGDSHQI